MLKRNEQLCVFSHLHLHKAKWESLEKKNEIQYGDSQGLVPFTRNIYSLGVKKFVVSFIYIK